MPLEAAPGLAHSDIATSTLAAQLLQRLGYLAQDPQNLNLLADCADLSMQAGKLAEAEALIDRALALSPDDAYFNTRKASVAMAQSRVDEASRQSVY